MLLNRDAFNVYFYMSIYSNIKYQVQAPGEKISNLTCDLDQAREEKRQTHEVMDQVRHETRITVPFFASKMQVDRPEKIRPDLPRRWDAWCAKWS